MLGLPFREVWVLDFEYLWKEGAQAGTQTTPVCMVARELGSDRLIRRWLFGSRPPPPFEISDDVLFVTYFATAELGSFLALGWPLPRYIIDLYTEFWLVTNEFNPFRRSDDSLELAKREKQGRKLLDALKWAGIPGITSDQKTAERELIRRGAPWTTAEQHRIITYCQTDVDPLGALLERLLLHIRRVPSGLAQALYRGRYWRPVAHAEHDGLMVDLPEVQRLRRYWEPIKLSLVRDLDTFGMYDGTTLKRDRLYCHLYKHGIDWPRTATGLPKTDQKTWEANVPAHPQLAPLAELHHTLNDLKLEQIAIGLDGRNRALLGPFGTATGRNAPKASEYLFSQAKWLRPWIKPHEGRALAYLDWSSHEVAIAAALANDAALLDAVSTGDPYMGFLRMAGMVPADAARADYEELRALAKTCFLAQNYGQGVAGLAARTGMSYLEADDLRRRMMRTFPKFTTWSAHMVDVAQGRGCLSTKFGWLVHVAADDRETSLKNFMVQATGAEMFRLAACLGSERGVSIVAMVHDAVMVEGPADAIEDTIATMRAAMDEASKTVLDGYVVNVDEKIVRFPDRYIDPDGWPMWNKVQGFLTKLERDDDLSAS
jgi:DNA polymerase I